MGSPADKYMAFRATRYPNKHIPRSNTLVLPVGIAIVIREEETRDKNSSLMLLYFPPVLRLGRALSPKRWGKFLPKRVSLSARSILIPDCRLFIGRRLIFMAEMRR